MSVFPSADAFETRNFVLSSLTPDEMDAIRPHLEPIELIHGSILYDVDDDIDHIYFPSNGMVSVVSSTLSGQTTEVGVVGREGFSGLEALLNGTLASINRQMIQLPGNGYRARTDIVKQEFLRGGSLQRMALKFTRATIAQIGQTSLCNRLHVAEQRLAKWLLMCHDRVDGDVLRITQEFAAIMLGSNRTSVTLAAQHLQEAGYIEYKRGRIAILDRMGLEAFACECYERIANEYRELGT